LRFGSLRSPSRRLSRGGVGLSEGRAFYRKTFTPPGRSLRDLDLRSRIFKYPCSFLILNPAFDALPAPMRDSILTGTDQDPQFAKIAAADRQAILEIFRETKPNLPEVWRVQRCPKFPLQNRI
jgi:hypothetical protein